MLRSQNLMSDPGLPPFHAVRGQHRKYRPLVFTEHGAIMAAMLLRSARDVAMSVYVVRAGFAGRKPALLRIRNCLSCATTLRC